jgi:hypothetical protein
VVHGLAVALPRARGFFVVVVVVGHFMLEVVRVAIGERLGFWVLILVGLLSVSSQYLALAVAGVRPLLHLRRLELLFVRRLFDGEDVRLLGCGVVGLDLGLVASVFFGLFGLLDEEPAEDLRVAQVTVPEVVDCRQPSITQYGERALEVFLENVDVVEELLFEVEVFLGVLALALQEIEDWVRPAYR